MTRLHRSQALMTGQQRGGIGGEEWDDKRYDDVLNLDGCYYVYVYVRNPDRDRKMETRKVAERRRKERMGTAPLT